MDAPAALKKVKQATEWGVPMTEVAVGAMVVVHSDYDGKDGLQMGEVTSKKETTLMITACNSYVGELDPRQAYCSALLL
jgi:hypothetical protein